MTRACLIQSAQNGLITNPQYEEFFTTTCISLSKFSRYYRNQNNNATYALQGYLNNRLADPKFYKERDREGFVNVF